MIVYMYLFFFFFIFFVEKKRIDLLLYLYEWNVKTYLQRKIGSVLVPEADDILKYLIIFLRQYVLI